MPLPEVQRTIHRTSAVAAVIGAVLSPIPLADEVVLLPLFLVLTRSIARIREVPRAQIPWGAILGTGVAGLGARAAINLTVGFIPGVAAVANATSAALLTELVGAYADAACTDPQGARVLSMKQWGEALRQRLKDRPMRGPRWWPWRRREAT